MPNQPLHSFPDERPASGDAESIQQPDSSNEDPFHNLNLLVDLNREWQYIAERFDVEWPGMTECDLEAVKTAMSLLADGKHNADGDQCQSRFTRRRKAAIDEVCRRIRVLKEVFEEANLKKEVARLKSVDARLAGVRVEVEAAKREVLAAEDELRLMNAERGTRVTNTLRRQAALVRLHENHKKLKVLLQQRANVDADLNVQLQRIDQMPDWCAAVLHVKPASDAQTIHFDASHPKWFSVWLDGVKHGEPSVPDATGRAFAAVAARVFRRQQLRSTIDSWVGPPVNHEGKRYEDDDREAVRDEVMLRYLWRIVTNAPWWAEEMRLVPGLSWLELLLTGEDTSVKRSFFSVKGQRNPYNVSAFRVVERLCAESDTPISKPPSRPKARPRGVQLIGTDDSIPEKTNDLDDLIESDAEDALLSARTLTDQERKAIQLRGRGNRSTKIARMLEMSVADVKRILRVARGKLRVAHPERWFDAHGLSADERDVMRQVLRETQDAARRELGPRLRKEIADALHKSEDDIETVFASARQRLSGRGPAGGKTGVEADHNR